MSDALAQISKAGVAVCLDDLSRDRLKSGSLAKLIKEDSVVGVTTNPIIFASAISKSDLYRSDILQNKDKSIEEIITKITTDDVREACDLFSNTFKESNEIDGRVSLEVDPRFALDPAATIKQGKELWNIVDRRNLLIKVPGTIEGLPAVTELIAQGISVNITLIFSIDRYKKVLDAFASGLEMRVEKSQDISNVHSVASFFISRIDVEVDTQLGNQPDLKGLAAIANAIMAYEAYLEFDYTKTPKQYDTIVNKYGKHFDVFEQIKKLMIQEKLSYTTFKNLVFRNATIDNEKSREMARARALVFFKGNFNTYIDRFTYIPSLNVESYFSINSKPLMGIHGHTEKFTIDELYPEFSQDIKKYVHHYYNKNMYLTHKMV
jgi:transaldolase